MTVSIGDIHLMRYYEEVLAQSARNYAFTQDKKWEERYKIYEPESTKLLKYAMMNSEQEDVKIFATLDKANMAMVEMEYNAINLVNSGRPEDAISLLEGAEYETQRKILTGGLADYVNLRKFKDKDAILSPTFRMIIDLEKKIAINEAVISNERFAAIGQLASRISHDLRNPLSLIQNTVDLMMLKYPNLDKNMKKYLTIISNEVSRMNYQIGEILDHVSPKPLQIGSFSLSKILKSVIKRTIMPSTVKINLPEKDINIVCDNTKLEVVFANLITNAIQAMNNVGQITIRAYEQDSNIMIEVEDIGPGIANDVLSQIFDPLFTTKQTGTGLGLPSCKNIIEKHGGTIQVKTELGIGTTFIIKLPKRDIISKPDVLN